VSPTEPRPTDVACTGRALELRFLGRRQRRASTHSDVDEIHRLRATHSDDDEILGGREGRGSTTLKSLSYRRDQREGDRLREEGGSARDLGRTGGARLDGARVVRDLGRAGGARLDDAWVVEL
jgi:hypothetical protein